MSSTNAMLQIRNLKVQYSAQEGKVHAVDGVDFSLRRGQTLGIVGESGCGKSATAMSILGLNGPAGRAVDGQIWFNNQNLLTLSEPQIRALRGNRISMIFQEPMTSLNPVFTIGDQVAEVFRIHLSQSKKVAMQNAIEMLHLVGIPHPQQLAYHYPHQLSGGMRQRVMIAMALALQPDLLIADEPTTALDVTIQAQVMDLLKKMQREMGMGILLITHDLGLVFENCDHVAVMYAGVIVESAPTLEIFARPRHPYTVGLLNSVPRGDRRKRLKTIEGLVPSLLHPPKGCRFFDRCENRTNACAHAFPPLVSSASGRHLRCFNPIVHEA